MSPTAIAFSHPWSSARRIAGHVRRLVPLEELRDAHLPLRIAGPGIEEHVPNGLARFDGETTFFHLLQGRRGRRQDDVLREGAGDALREDELVDRDGAVTSAAKAKVTVNRSV